ncbi:MAG: hypothetical protein Unbinned7865contig1001_69 [Prokaryotic dsDNA virus sp.]|nr:MAG: hypothetical protein Unbinned7865contig1001_69 [Prokaryotic dsDNA virus sp.]|tara:strand:- start:14343 stop:15062 length:720 start_codon:yes stop_codon:yes gene_type:complete
MQIKLESLDGLPEGLKSAVTEADGANVLDLTKLMPAEDLTGLKGALSKERANNAAWSALGESPDAVKAAMQELKDAKPAGKNDEQVAQMIDQVKAEYSGKLDSASEQLDALRRKTTSAEIKAELAKAGAMPDALDVVANFANSRMVFASDGSLQITTADGKPMVGSGENHTATMTDLAKDLAASMPFAFKDAGSGGGGKQPGSNGGTPPSGLNRSKMKPDQKASYIGEKGLDAYNALPE